MSIRLKEVSYCYGARTNYEIEALKNISCTINKGEFVGIMGKTGCGKSTFIQLMAGLLIPSSGSVFLDEENINEKNYQRQVLRKKVAVVFQYPEYQLFESTVEKDLAFGLRQFDWPKEKKKKAIVDALRHMGFDYEKVKDLSPLEFSGGEKRRLAIAGVLAVQPEILILDEPIAGLDPFYRESFLKLLQDMNDAGTTIIMISHNTDLLLECVERVILLENGEILKDGKKKEVFQDINFLKQHDIGIGQVLESVELLRQRGYQIPSTTISYQEFLEQLQAIRRGDLS